MRRTVKFYGAWCDKETEKAILVDHADFEEETWIPKTQVHDDSEVWKEGQEGVLVITEWIAKQKGLA